MGVHYYEGNRSLKERVRTTTDTGTSDLTWKETWVYDDLGRMTEEKTYGRDVSGEPYEIVVHAFTFDGLGRQV